MVNRNKAHSGKPKELRNKFTSFPVIKEIELLPFLLESMPSKGRNLVKNYLRDGQIYVDEVAISQYNQILKIGQTVKVDVIKAPEKMKFHGLKIIFEDEHLILIDKKEGMLSISTEKQKNMTAYSILSDHIKSQNPSNRLFVVHRLDRETSGIMMFAKSQKVQKILQENWGPTTKERTYVTVVQGVPEHDLGTHTSYLIESKALIVYSTKDTQRGQLAITHYETIKKNSWYALLKVNLETGRKNQIRVHMQDMGHPIIGDEKYGSTKDPINRLALHALSLGFKHPITGEELSFEAEMPSSFLSIFNK